jgi:protocatechuate 3,4-dioxygenase beta subunit
MRYSRRNFCKNSAYLGIGLVLSPSIIHAQTNDLVGNKALILTKRAQKVVKVSGKIRYNDLSPIQNTIVEIWHNHSESNPSSFEYEGKLQTDADGNYSFETDFPEKHFEQGYFNTRRIYFKFKDQNGAEFLTKLHFGYDGKAFVDNFHVNNVPDKFKLILPKTKFEENLFTVQFDIYLNTKGVTSFA